MVLHLAVVATVAAVAAFEDNTVPRGPMPGILIETHKDPVEAAHTIFEGPAIGVAGLVFSPDVSRNTPSDETFDAISALTRAAIAENFIAIRLNGSSLAAAMDGNTDAFVHAASWARGAGLRGVYIQFSPRAPWFDPRGPEFDERIETPAQLMLSAGADITRAILTTYPEATVLLSGGPADEAGSLFWPFIAGSIAAAAAASAPCAIVVDAPGMDTSPEQIERVHREFTRMVERRLDGPALMHWRSACGLSVRIASTHWPAAAEHPWRLTGDQASALAHTAMLSDPYIVLTDGADDWLQAREETVQKSTPDVFDFGSLRRAGRISSRAGAGFALRTPRGGALLFPSGPSQPFHAAAPKSIDVFEFHSGTRDALGPQDGHVVVPAHEHAVIADGLTVRDTILPAGLWFRADPIEESANPHARRFDTSRRWPVSFGYVNETGFSVRGAVHLLTPPRVTVTPSEAAFELSAGEAVTAHAMLTGALTPGRAIDIEIVLVQASGDVSKRFTTVYVPPRLVWERPLEGPAGVRPLIADITGDGALEFLAASAHGGLVCLDEHGTEMWRHALDATIRTGIAMGRQWSGHVMAAAADDAGVFRAFDAQGAPLWTADLGGLPRPDGVLAAELHPYPGSEWIAAMDNGVVVALASSGGELWRIQFETGSLWVTAADVTGDGRDELFIATGGQQPALHRVDAAGSIAWSVPLPSTASASPHVIEHGETPRVYVGTRQGHLLTFDSAIGRELVRIDAGEFGSVLSIHTADLLTSEGSEVYAVLERGLVCYDARGDLVWQREVACAAPGALTRTLPAALLVPLADGHLLAVDAFGERLWADRRSALRLDSTPAWAVTPDGKQVFAMQASRDHFVRVLEVLP